ncbi:hypothetical protein RFI_04958, partial [Reticulomyxa filosa]
MGNQNTIQNSPEGQTEQKQTITTASPFQDLTDSYTALAKLEKPKQSQNISILSPFQNVKDLPTPLSLSQCVLHKHEILICGGVDKRDCYSYHTIKDEYKFICEYPSNVRLSGHCVIKLVDNNSSKNKDSNEITLLSFGGNTYTRHTLVMNYVSVWNDDDEMNKSKQSNNCNQWFPLTDSSNYPIHIGRSNDNHCGVRALIGGSNNHLLFIAYEPKKISVFNLNTLEFISDDILPTMDKVWYHCFVPKSENEIKKKNNEMLLFYQNTGLSIEYDEKNDVFQFHKIAVCDDIASFYKYAYVYTNDAILFFGGYGWNGRKYTVSKAVHKYLIQENKWITFELTLPIPLRDCFGILNQETSQIHIIGGCNDKIVPVSTHMKTKVSAWRDASHL